MILCPRCNTLAPDDAARCPGCFASLSRPQTNRIQAPTKETPSSTLADSTRQVFIKTTEGEIRGPYSFEAAESLLRHGKIEPFWEVSEDKISWRVAEKLFGFTPAKTTGNGNESQIDPNSTTAWGMQLNIFNMLMHLAQLLWIVGLILIIVMWATNTNNKTISEHGKNIINWYISALIYGIAVGILSIIPYVGILTILIYPAIAVCTLIFLIIGAVKAAHGIVWKYPLAIPLIKSS